MELLKLIGNSEPIETVNRLIQQVARTSSNVMILGESGTGKELVARIIHQHSTRKAGPFIPVNCAAIPLDLLESELFGHEKGAFTGAIITRQGKFELAAGGSLFLDEIGDMPYAMQAKLLRVIQERCFERVGGSRSIRAEVRIIAATHKNLPLTIQEGGFREDLFYRLNVFPIEIPPLRARKEDILILIQHFIAEYQANTRSEINLQPETLAFLQEYAWPGNVRELANLIERLMILYPGKSVGLSDLPEQFFQKQHIKIPTLRENKNLTVMSTVSEIDSHSEFFHSEFQTGFDLKEHLAKLEFELIHQALKVDRGVVSHAAKRLGLRRTTLVEKMKKYGMERGIVLNQNNLNG